MTARSVVASTLLGVEPPRLTTRILVRSGELFGIAEGTTRVALSRMVAAGEAPPRRRRLPVGRAPARPPGAPDRQPPGRDRSVGRHLGAGDRARRRGRRAADRCRCATPWRTCGWPAAKESGCGPPTCRPTGRPTPGSSPPASASRAGTTPRPAARPAALWDLDGWADDARALQAELTELQPRFEAHDTGALGVGFVASAAVLRLLQRDPLLPRALRPASWPGDDLRRAYDRYDAAYRAVWTDWFRRQR